MKSLTVIALAALLGTANSIACVGCREPGKVTLVEEPQTVLAGLGFSWSVLFLLAVAFSVVGGITGYIVQTIRRIERERQ
jgi:hypothetical protein